ncbi:hypothetical protein [Nostoc sphaeroides]|uniref:Uncharacterized protein n=1 Tax=Nostoc sphaeroides CCNUC1 TaxID=2653204 RepID=A0A5P8W6S1_9NOSO|nr:hypothetical protein [Nostoc sphaeroides]QFS48457.1 hypothetical protein GXM_05951 [Nostoc sphaeroides CCNUC1]
MRQFTLFTLLYLATGVCLMAIALQYPEITPNLKATLLFNAGLSYIVAVLSTFRFWREATRQSQARLRQQPAWKQNFVAIAPWLVIALTLVASLSNLLHDNWATEAIVKASIGLPLILLSAEQLFIRSQFRQ